MAEVVAVVPATDKNRYSERGDLAAWGDSSLLEWKIAQLRSVRGIDRIVVSATTPEVARIAVRAGAQAKLRPEGLELPAMFRHAVEDLPDEAGILWANPSSPFAGARVFRRLLDGCRDTAPQDGTVTARRMREYLFGAEGALGFDAGAPARSRVDLPEVKVLTNGASFGTAGGIRARGSLFGVAPGFLEVDWLEALEIRGAEQMGLFEGLIARHMEAEA